MPKQSHRKDIAVIVAVLAVAALLLLASRLMPRTDLANRVAQDTLAPDAVELLTPTPASASEATEPPVQATGEPQQTAAPEESAPTEAPQQSESQSAGPMPAGPMPAQQEEQASAYVVLTVNGRQYGQPIPMDRAKIVTIEQDDGMINRVYISKTEVYMESSTCENQDCVGQGHVTLDNYDTRILGSWIICLPNAVTVELVPAEE